MVNKNDIIANKPSANSIITVSSGEIVLAETENSNNQLALGSIITAYNWIIDSGADLSLPTTFTGKPTFNGGVNVGEISPLTTNGNVTFDVGTGDVYKGSVTTSNAFQTKSQVDSAISNAGSLQLTLTYRGIETLSFNALSASVYWIDCSGGAITATLPASPANGDAIKFVNYADTVTATNTFTIDGNGNNIQGDSDDQILTSFAFVTLIYDSIEGWYKS